MKCCSCEFKVPALSSFGVVFKQNFKESSTFRLKMLAIPFFATFLIACTVATLNGSPFIAETFYTIPAQCAAFCGLIGGLVITFGLIMEDFVKVWKNAIQLDNLVHNKL